MIFDTEEGGGIKDIEKLKLNAAKFKAEALLESLVEQG